MKKDRQLETEIYVLLNISLGTRDIIEQRTVSSYETVLGITYGLRSPHFPNLLCIRLPICIQRFFKSSN